MAAYQKSNNHIFKVIDFFCGGGEKMCGLRQAGFGCGVFGGVEGVLMMNLIEKE